MLNEDLIKNAVEVLKELKFVKAIMLYGSYAREEEHKGSDIDLLIVINVKNPKKYLKEVIRRLSNIDKEGIISPRLTNFKDYDLDFFKNVLREGKLLYGSFILSPNNLALKPFRLINYDLKNLEYSKKVKISRRVHGYETVKENKKYKYIGLKDEEGVSVISKSTVLLPEKLIGFVKFLKREGVPFKERKIWM